MHELSIALNILDIAGRSCQDQGYGRIDAIRVRIGRASSVMPDALRFAFETARSGTPAAGARLEIEESPVGGHCKSCGRDFTVEEAYVFNCPLCGGSSFEITSGYELDIVELEVDE